MKVKAKVAAPKAVKEKKAPNRAVGKTLGLGVTATWVNVFKSNAKDHKTDAEITKFMNSEFPARKSAVFERVQHVRAQYNRGVFSEGGAAPKQLSSRYDEEGNKTTARAGRPKVEKIPAKAKSAKAA